jgi:hypothetical protein
MAGCLNIFKPVIILRKYFFYMNIIILFYNFFFQLYCTKVLNPSLALIIATITAIFDSLNITCCLNEACIRMLLTCAGEVAGVCSLLGMAAKPGDCKKNQILNFDTSTHFTSEFKFK